jgi:formate dehydrogenase
LCTYRLDLSAQARYAAGTREIIEDFLAGRSIQEEYLIVAGGALAGTGARSYTADGTSSPGSSGQ